MSRIIYQISSDTIVVESTQPEDRKLFEQLKARRSWFHRKKWYIHYDSRGHLSICLTALRDACFSFVSTQHGWPPASVFEKLREDGLVEGSFTEISWLGPNDPRLKNNPGTDKGSR